jgi:nitrate reductase molybdenum cofactor assembly chaperone
MHVELYDRLAALFVYPDYQFAEKFDAALESMEAEDIALAEKLTELAQHVSNSAVEDLEEAYTRTFDINATCTLELGWHLFGEDYNRGAFLVHVRQLMRDMGIEESQELPDHLTHILPLVARLKGEAGTEFAQRFAIPGMDKMVKGFSDKENPYRPALEGVIDLLVRDFGRPELPPTEIGVRTGPYEGTPGGTPFASPPGCGVAPNIDYTTEN